MKVTISYMPDEVREADMILRFVQNVLPSARVRKSVSHLPQISVYLTTNKVGKRCGTTGNA